MQKTMVLRPCLVKNESVLLKYRTFHIGQRTNQLKLTMFSDLSSKRVIFQISLNIVLKNGILIVFYSMS